MDLTAEPGLSMTVFTAEPASPSDDGLRLLGTWAAGMSTSAFGTASQPAE
jgi:hypothetical protein